MALDDFEELLADKPRNGCWELIGGRVVRMMVGARWEHARIVRNIALGLETGLEIFDRVKGRWSGFRVVEGLGEALDLPAIQGLLPMRDIYDRVLAG